MTDPDLGTFEQDVDFEAHICPWGMAVLDDQGRGIAKGVLATVDFRKDQHNGLALQSDARLRLIVKGPVQATQIQVELHELAPDCRAPFRQFMGAESETGSCRSRE